MSVLVNGAWSCWSSWSQCSASCGGGHYQRTRMCSNPPPASGGDICIGLHTEEALCNTHVCEGMTASIKLRHGWFLCKTIYSIPPLVGSRAVTYISVLWFHGSTVGVTLSDQLMFKTIR